MRLAVLALLAAAISLQSQEISHTTPPHVIDRADPDYTKEALDAKIEGDVILSLIIGTDGIPSDIKLIRGLGKGLDEKAIDCLQQWRFSPATNHGKPIAQEATFEMNFRLPRSSDSK
jgi:periplasmic protein TonB